MYKLKVKFRSQMKKGLISVLVLTLATFLIVLALPSVPFVFAQGTVRDFYITVKYDFGGPGYNVFYPQTLVVQEGDQVNITIRNVGSGSFVFNLEGQNDVSIKPGTQNDSSIVPVDTPIPLFKASTSGIFDIGTDKYPEMIGQLVVLPSNSSSYSPTAKTRSFTQVVLPDFSGDSYDKFFPGVIVVNQGDTVNVSVRNTDDAPHGFAIAAYNLNAAIQPGTNQANGSITPYTTSISPFTASQAGVFRWFCTDPCGPGHFEMVGQLVVLAKQPSSYGPDVEVRYSYPTIKPNFSGDGYSMYMPNLIFANQNDFVYIKVRNTDGQAHGFTMSGYSINNQTIAAGNFSDPSQTYVPQSSLDAKTAGVFEFTCSYNCGPQPNQLNGQLVILASQTSTLPSPSSSPTPTTPSLLVGELAAGILIIGVVGGVAIAAIFSRQRQEVSEKAT